MSAVRPWHLLALLCCCFVFTVAVGGTVFAVVRSRRPKP